MGALNNSKLKISQGSLIVIEISIHKQRQYSLYNNKYPLFTLLYS